MGAGRPRQTGSVATNPLFDPWRREIPANLPILERDVVRLVVLDAAELVLLLDAGDSTAPAAGRCWELPGGGIEPGESYITAAVRELAEETGIVINAAMVGPATWRRSASYQYRGRRRIQHEVVTFVHVPARRPPVVAAGRDADERQDCVGSAWWPISDITTSTGLFYPGRLPELLPRFLAGERINEPFELWS